ncbi:sodium:proton symporter [Polymorphum gilvum]|uniref:Sodium Bile acid symporter family protein n=1 Tax=Polymorphum gilvum (strain LMG 25793 / CGMCC 1.9160 / SL003B-26A1) TaxID=991905 RepID=F2J4X7_POLGS|nr:sodium:proton symporter [Polymorphum gilvum]ADZ70020.1 Sodium Bile acid symporter family protein [Polymorphum gilvum SL003B-26A1]
MIRGATAALAWIGRRGTSAVALSALAGMAVPQLSALARPWVAEAIFVLLVFAFLRVDPAAVRVRLRRPRLVLLAALWMTVAVPLVAGTAARAAGLADLQPDLMLALFIVTAAPAIMSAPAFMYLLGLDGALSLTVLVASILLVPLSAPLIGELMLGDVLPVDGLTLAVKLISLLAGSMLIAWLLRRLVGLERIAAAHDHIDGANVLLLLFFAVAVMDGVAASFSSRPLLSAGIALLTFAVALAQIGLTLLVFAPAARGDAFVIAHAVGNRNMGLMVAALGGTLPDLTWLYFGLGQLPIYMLPLFLRPFSRRYTGRSAPAPAPPV